MFKLSYTKKICHTFIWHLVPPHYGVFTMDKMTATQLKALTFIRTTMDSTGSAPTLREICQFMGYSAVGSAQDLISALRRKGFLEEPSKQAARSNVPTIAARGL
jgi:SOS-response transcriptional repressor LexA